TADDARLRRAGTWTQATRVPPPWSADRGTPASAQPSPQAIPGPQPRPAASRGPSPWGVGHPAPHWDVGLGMPAPIPLTMRGFGNVLAQHGSMSSDSLIENLPDLVLMVRRDGIVVGHSGGHGVAALKPRTDSSGQSIDALWPKELAVL